MAMAAGGKGGLNADMNVTPLIDVLLVLLVIFMVVVPLSQMGYDIQVPQSRDSYVEPKPQIILAVNESLCPITQELKGMGLPPNCSVRINKEEVRVTDLAKRIAEIYEGKRTSEKIIFLAAQEKLNYEGVMRILDITRQAGGEDLKVGIVTDEALALGSSGSTGSL